MKVDIKGGDGLEAFIKKITASDAESLNVGFLQATEATKAVKNEYGGNYKIEPGDYRNWLDSHGYKNKLTVTIPPRPFMSTTVTKKSKEWQKLLIDIIPKFNFDSNKILNTLGHKITGDIQESIEDGEWVENSVLTKKYKGGRGKSLIDHGDMLRSVDFEVK